MEHAHIFAPITYTDSSQPHDPNASFPKVALFGMKMEIKLVHPKKASLPMRVTVSGNITVDKLEH